ncbi:MAG: hypothetical protein V4690_03215 [Patescibacteria group bacterium]
METKSILSRKLSDKGLVWTGLILIVIAVGMHISKVEFFDLFVVALLLIGSLMLGFGVARLYFEPNGKPMNLEHVSPESPSRIPDNNIRGTNFLLSWCLLYLGFTTIGFYLYDLNYWIIGVSWMLFIFALIPICSIRSRKYYVYPDRLSLQIGFPSKVVTDIYFKDIATIKKTRAVPYAWSGMPLKSYNISNTRISLFKSVYSEFGGAMTNNSGGSAILVVLKNKEVFLLPSVLLLDDTVESLNKLKELSGQF